MKQSVSGGMPWFVIDRRGEAGGRIVTKIQSITATVCAALLATSGRTAPAQDRPQAFQNNVVLAQPLPDSPIVGTPRSSPTGFNPTTVEAWPRSGRTALSGMKPLPPGYVPNENGDIVYRPPLGYIKPHCPAPRFMWWLCPQWTAAKCQQAELKCQEVQSFNLYIRGYGPAIHTRPASSHW
jgi:hypothetical protein